MAKLLQLGNMTTINLDKVTRICFMEERAFVFYEHDGRLNLDGEEAKNLKMYVGRYVEHAAADYMPKR